MGNSKGNLGLILILLGVCGFVLYSINIYKTKDVPPVAEPIATSTSLVIYSNSDFGFNFSLPESWRGYSIIENLWEGNPLVSTSTPQTGPKLLIRNPKWTSALPYEDIPVLVFTLEQWDSYQAENFSVSAAPVQATELGRNNLYVFALPPRWNFDYSEGYEEAENIIKSNPLQAFTIMQAISGRLNTDLICEDSLAYMAFTDSTSADVFVAECKEGKHPEVIEKYKAEMNIPNEAAI